MQPSMRQMTADLRDAGLPIQAIAHMMNTGRLEVYGWLDGNTPLPVQLGRMRVLHDGLLAAGTDLRALYRYWHSPGGADSSCPSLQALLAQHPLDVARIRGAMVHLVPLATATDQRMQTMACPDGANGFVLGLHIGKSGID